MRFRVPAHKHYARPLTPRIHFGQEEFSWKINIYDSCRYPDVDIARREQINKLPGFTCELLMHNNSFRFGWRYNDKTGKADIFAYFYIDGVRPSLPTIEDFYKVASVNFNQSYTYKLFELHGNIHFLIVNYKNEEIGSNYVRYNGKIGTGWMLRMFNGGSETYDHDFHMSIERIE